VKVNGTAVILFMYILLIGCSQTISTNDLDIPVMKEGYDSTEYELERESAKQLSFKVDLPYHSKEAFFYYFDFYKNNGWSLCGEVGDWVKHSYLDKNRKIVDTERIMVSAN